MMAPRFKGKPNFDFSQPCPLCGYRIQPYELMRLASHITISLLFAEQAKDRAENIGPNLRIFRGEKVNKNLTRHEYQSFSVITQE